MKIKNQNIFFIRNFFLLNINSKYFLNNKI